MAPFYADAARAINTCGMTVLSRRCQAPIPGTHPVLSFWTCEPQNPPTPGSHPHLRSPKPSKTRFAPPHANPKTPQNQVRTPTCEPQNQPNEGSRPQSPKRTPRYRPRDRETESSRQSRRSRPSCRQSHPSRPKLPPELPEPPELPPEGPELPPEGPESPQAAPRKAQRGPEKHRGSLDRTSLSGAWLGAFHKQIYDQGGSPQADLRPGRLPTSRFTTREAPHRFLYGTQEEAPADYH